MKREELFADMPSDERNFAAGLLQTVVQMCGPIASEKDLEIIVGNIRKKWAALKEGGSDEN